MKKSLLALLIAAAPLCLFAQLPSYLPTNGLVGWWPFNGNANDESGNGNNGTVNGATLTSDRFGSANSAYEYNGQTHFIEVQANSQTNFNSTTDFSISLWFKTSSIDDEFRGMISKGGFGGGEDISFQLAVRNGVCLLELKDITNLQSTININDSEWKNLVLIVDRVNSNAKIYLNGVLDFVTQQPSIGVNDYSSSNPIRFGTDRIMLPNLNFFLGFLDDIAIYNRALTPEEITALYTSVPTDNNGGGSSATTTVPAGISYQAVARNAQGQPLSDAAVQVRFTLLADSLTGAAEYSESHSLTTNSLGLFTTAFGAGTAETGTFANINWASGSKYLNVELDAGNGFVDMGTQQLLSVPYSMRSNTSAKAGTIENAGLPVYADNAAALAGGLIAGQMYRTATGDLKIVY